MHGLRLREALRLLRVEADWVIDLPPRCHRAAPPWHRRIVSCHLAQMLSGVAISLRLALKFRESADPLSLCKAIEQQCPTPPHQRTRETRDLWSVRGSVVVIVVIAAERGSSSAALTGSSGWRNYGVPYLKIVVETPLAIVVRSMLKSRLIKYYAL